MSNNTNNFIINPLRINQHSNDSSKFAIQISFERSFGGITGILISYHMMCALLVITASLNFLIDPKIVPGRAGMLVTLFLVLANFFSDAQVIGKYLRIKGQVLKIRACNTAQVAVLQHEWRSHECCNTATSAVLHASIFNT